MNALSAYFGVVDVGQSQRGETLLVSGAAGSVIGICGGPEKVEWLKESCGMPEVIDYKAQDVGEALETLCPDGVDVFFDNVGGTMLRDVVQRMRRQGELRFAGRSRRMTMQPTIRRWT